MEEILWAIPIWQNFCMSPLDSLNDSFQLTNDLLLKSVCCIYDNVLFCCNNPAYTGFQLFFGIYEFKFKLQYLLIKQKKPDFFQSLA